MLETVMMARGYIIDLLTSPFIIIRNLIHFRHMLVQMVLRDIKGRFAGSIGGLLWNFIHPLVMLAVYLFVFVYIFRIRIGASEDAGMSAMYITTGLFPWMIFSEGLMRGTTVLFENANLIQKTHFPTEILSAGAVLTPIASYGIVMLLLAIYSIFSEGSFLPLALLPLIFGLQLFFTLGMVFLSSTLSVYFRDTVQLVQIIINFWIYLTPILYPINMLPDWARHLMYLNPVFPFINVYQSLFIDISHLKPEMISISAFWAGSIYCFGAFIFNKLKYEFADWL